jgi:hypothetical protein
MGKRGHVTVFQTDSVGGPETLPARFPENHLIAGVSPLLSSRNKITSYRSQEAGQKANCHSKRRCPWAASHLVCCRGRNSP